MNAIIMANYLNIKFLKKIDKNYELCYKKLMEFKKGISKYKLTDCYEIIGMRISSDFDSFSIKRYVDENVDTIFNLNYNDKYNDFIFENNHKLTFKKEFISSMHAARFALLSKLCLH